MINLTKEVRASLYAFLIRPPNIIINTQERGAFVLAHTLDDALASAIKDHPNTSITLISSCVIEDILKHTKDDENAFKQATGDAGEATKAQPPPQAMIYTPLSFIAGLKMAKDRYVKSPTDKKQLTKIITNLEKKYAEAGK